ncbi:MAG TPA: carbohydrate ABC transporter permease [Candidatus Acetatifactor stercoripullorum]|uniref:Carbohydrate ABC transporter permease n=1 Tax=Candidatus Acetatifactor stercoripullorum TaxID=2838414 RepID=A0A9D1UBY9_9FIRM|nr:carbohydrate ABC transporter permease [uncultured Acetatifactor sp.]HIW82244.1 carbohydrate ABC transporter permease [Candidatus Acetatifactor stercoripullorum]
MRNKGERLKSGLILLYMFLCILPVILFFLFILCNSFLSSDEFLKNYGMIEHGKRISQYAELSLLPEKFSFEQYKGALWENSDFWYYFWNSVRISGLIAAGTVVVSTGGAYALSKLHFPGKRLVLLSVILIMMLPYQIMLAPQMMLMDKIGLLNHSASVILPNIFTTFGVYLLYQFMENIPKECSEAAQMDGAGHILIFFKIILPQIKDGISALLILNLIDTWNLVEQPLLFLENQYQYPLSVILSEGETLIENHVFACCVIFLIPVLLVFLACKDSLLNGISSSVLK